MTTQTIRTGQNVVVVQDTPTRNYSDPKWPRVITSEVRTLLLMPMPNLRDEVVNSDILSVPVAEDLEPQTISVQALDGKWDSDRVTWSGPNAQPDVVGVVCQEVVTVTIPKGDRLEIDITDIAQAVANGQRNHGFRISTDDATGAVFRGFRSGNDSWRQVIETSDQAEQPENVTPAGVISLEKWVCQLNDYDELIAMRVQVDPLQDGDDPEFDSGFETTTEPILDLATEGYGGLADTAVTSWRAKARQSDDGSDGDWSEWAQVTRHIKPVFEVDNPVDGILWDSSPTVVGHVDSGVIEQWRLVISDPDDPAKVRYDTGLKDGDGTDTIEWEIPGYDPDSRKVVMPVDGDYLFTWKIWDRNDRVASQGDPPYILLEQIVTLTADGAEEPATDLEVVDAQAGTPGVTIRWQRGASPDFYLVFRDDVQVLRAAHAELLESAGTWEWFDPYAPPNKTSVYTVRAVTNGVQSEDSETLEVFNAVDGFWIVSVHGNVKLIGKDIDQITKKDKRATYNLPGRRDEIDIITAFGGYSGPFAGELNGIRGDIDADAALASLKAIKYDALTEVQLVYVDTSFPALLKNVDWGPHRDSSPKAGRARYRVSFECTQSSDFDDDGLTDA